MPEMRFEIGWPDGTRETCYSPSLIIKDYLAVGSIYPLAVFLKSSRAALKIASARVEEKYGFPCSRALGQLARLERAADRFTEVADAQVTVVSFHE